MECGYITDRQIEASRIAMTASSSAAARSGCACSRISHHQEAGEVRMGSGKGALDHWVAVVRPGKILFEMEGVDPATAREAMRLASNKLPLLTKFVMRPGAEKVEARQVEMQLLAASPSF